MATLLKAIEKIDKKVEWRERRIEEDRKDIGKLLAEREELSWRYRELNIAKQGTDE